MGQPNMTGPDSFTTAQQSVLSKEKLFLCTLDIEERIHYALNEIPATCTNFVLSKFLEKVLSFILFFCCWIRRMHMKHVVEQNKTML